MFTNGHISAPTISVFELSTPAALSDWKLSFIINASCWYCFYNTFFCHHIFLYNQHHMMIMINSFSAFNSQTLYSKPSLLSVLFFSISALKRLHHGQHGHLDHHDHHTSMTLRTIMARPSWPSWPSWPSSRWLSSPAAVRLCCSLNWELAGHVLQLSEDHHHYRLFHHWWYCQLWWSSMQGGWLFLGNFECWGKLRGGSLWGAAHWQLTLWQWWRSGRAGQPVVCNKQFSSEKLEIWWGQNNCIF